MVVDPTLLETAQRLKRATTNRDVLALCEAIIAGAGKQGCPECEKRRSQRAAAQKRWRDGKRRK